MPAEESYNSPIKAELCLQGKKYIVNNAMGKIGFLKHNCFNSNVMKS